VKKSLAIFPEFELSQRVYFPLDPDARGIVTAIRIIPGNVIIYNVMWDDREEKCHYASELCAEKIFSTEDTK
jgi:hypothetical protein